MKATGKLIDIAGTALLPLLNKNCNCFFTIPINRIPRNSSIRFSKNKDGCLTGK
jgi:hypothetical protein